MPIDGTPADYRETCRSGAAGRRGPENWRVGNLGSLANRTVRGRRGWTANCAPLRRSGPGWGTLRRAWRGDGTAPAGRGGGEGCGLRRDAESPCHLQSPIQAQTDATQSITYPLVSLLWLGMTHARSLDTRGLPMRIQRTVGMRETRIKLPRPSGELNTYVQHRAVRCESPGPCEF